MNFVTKTGIKNFACLITAIYNADRIDLLILKHSANLEFPVISKSMSFKCLCKQNKALSIEQQTNFSH